MLSFENGFTLAEIAERAVLPIERLRYVVDTGILPGLRRSKSEAAARQPGRGIPRKFMGFEAFSLVLVVLMLEGGVRRRVVREFMRLLMKPIVPSSQPSGVAPLIQVFKNEKIVALEIGDGLNVRLLFDEPDPAKSACQPSRWIQPGTRAIIDDYDPRLAVRINLARLREYFH
jgi:hypothetical protein